MMKNIQGRTGEPGAIYKGDLIMQGFPVLHLAAALATALQSGPLAAQWVAYTDDVHDGSPALIEQLDERSGLSSVPAIYTDCTGTPANTVYSVGFTSGLAYLGSTLHGLEWGSDGIYLYTMSASFCATGSRVGSQPVGFANLESLAYCSSDGQFYSADFDFAAHSGRLIRIDPLSGLGSVIGALGTSDLRITGMACSNNGQLYAVTAGHGGRSPELLTLDRVSGNASIIAATGTEALQSLAFVGEQLVAGGTALYTLNLQTGATSRLAAVAHGSAWAMAASAGTTTPITPITPPPTSTCTAGITALPAPPVMTLSISGQQAGVTWPAVSGASGYRLFYAPYSNPVTALTLEHIQSIDLGALTAISGSLARGTQLYLAAQSYNCSGSSSYSNISVVMIEP